jgi:hypothetical protein
MRSISETEAKAVTLDSQTPFTSIKAICSDFVEHFEKKSVLTGICDASVRAKGAFCYARTVGHSRPISLSLLGDHSDIPGISARAIYQSWGWNRKELSNVCKNSICGN